MPAAPVTEATRGFLVEPGRRRGPGAHSGVPGRARQREDAVAALAATAAGGSSNGIHPDCGM